MNIDKNSATDKIVGSSDVLYSIDFGTKDRTIVRCVECGWFAEVKTGRTCLEEWQKHRCQERVYGTTQTQR